MTRIGIFGGSFSPPHLGHALAAETFLSACALDRLLIIPTAEPPHKPCGAMPSGEHRLALCRLAFSGLPRTEVSDLEIKRAGKSYTYLTLRELSSPEHELFFLCGGDMLLTLDRWKNAEELFSLAHFVSVSRQSDRTVKEQLIQKCGALKEKFGARITLLDTDTLEISSTEVRKAIASGEDLFRFLAPEVVAYIKKWKLYQ